MHAKRHCSRPFFWVNKYLIFGILYLTLSCSGELVLSLVQCISSPLAWLLFWEAVRLVGSNFLQSLFPRDTICTLKTETRALVCLKFYFYFYCIRVRWLCFFSFLSSLVFQSATLVESISATAQVVVSIVPVLSRNLFSFVMHSFIRLCVSKF